MSNGAIGAVAERYSAALFELADQQGQLDAVAADLVALRNMMSESGDLRRVLDSPVIGREQQGKAMVALARKAGFSALVTNFLGVLAHNRRLPHLGGMIAVFLSLLAARRGEVSLKVTSAIPLAPAQTEAIAAAVAAAVGHKIAVDATVDPELIGGLVVQIGSRLVDGSLKTKLLRMKLAMKGIG